jgi:hypothetical protein
VDYPSYKLVSLKISSPVSGTGYGLEAGRKLFPLE